MYHDRAGLRFVAGQAICTVKTVLLASSTEAFAAKVTALRVVVILS